MSTPLLRLTSLCCERDDRQLFTDLNLEVHSGDIWHIEGPNGAGKTTLLRILAGLYEGYQGEMAWRGQPVRDDRVGFHADLLFLGHKSAVKRALTPLENLRALTCMTQQVAVAELFDALAQVGLMGFEHVPCAHLSAGQLRRVALARLFLSKASLWILDELFTAIDKEGVKKLEQFLQQQANLGRAIILTTHHALEFPGVQKLRLGSPVSLAPDNSLGALEQAGLQ